MAIQSVLFALCAPELDSSSREDRRAGIIGGDVVRDCAVIEWVRDTFPTKPSHELQLPSGLADRLRLASRSLPPVFSDPLLAKANYDALEKQVEERIKAGAKK
jgi:hypothetical protein